jgi:hypothetical protein
MKAVAMVPALQPISRALLDTLEEAGLPFLQIEGCRDLVYARSRLLTDALAHDASLFVFIDSDMRPSAADVRRLLAAPRLGPRDAVTGCYAMTTGSITAKGLDGKSLVLGDDDGTSETFVECLGAGLGFAAVPRATVEVVRDELPLLAHEAGAAWQPFFLPFVARLREGDDPRNLVYHAEDYAFWFRVRSLAGARLWADTGLRIGHAKRLVCQPGFELSSKTSA